MDINNEIVIKDCNFLNLINTEIKIIYLNYKKNEELSQYEFNVNGYFNS